ncbi:MAG: hypothetical protein IPN27_00140 [Cellvibrionales bacterium]|jgi:hypothetical protein|nr:hypothetical protein [Cellvibrionales bacterium]
MEFLVVIAAIVGLVCAYFCLGILLKFIVAWGILAVGIPILIVFGVLFGWAGAAVSVVGFIFLLHINNQWHSNDVYLALEKKIDRAFNLSDT